MDPLDQHMDTPIFEELRTKTIEDAKFGPGSVFAPRSGPIDLRSVGWPDIVKEAMWANPQFDLDAGHEERMRTLGYADADLPTDALFVSNADPFTPRTLAEHSAMANPAWNPHAPKPCEKCGGTWEHRGCKPPIESEEIRFNPPRHFQVIEGGKFPEDYKADHEGAQPMSWPMRIALALSILVIVACGIAFVVGALASHR